MNQVQKIAKNSTVQFFGDNLIRILSMVLVIFIARFLGDVDYGKFAFVLSFTGLFFILMDMGSRVLLVREITHNKNNVSKIMSNVFFFKIISSLFIYILIIILAFILSYDFETKLAISIATLGLIFDNFSISMASLFQAFEVLEYNVIAKVIRVLIRFTLTILALVLGYGYFTVLLIYVFVQFVNLFLVALICMKKYCKVYLYFDRKYILKFLRKAAPFFLSGIFATVYFRIDITILSKIAPIELPGLYDITTRQAVIGWYSAGYTLFDAISSLPIALSTALLPVAITSYKLSRARFKKMCQVGMKLLMYISIPIAFGVFFTADKIIQLLYNDQYTHSILALRLLIWTLIPLSINYILSLIIIAAQKEKKAIKVLLLIVIVNIVLNLLLIPKFSLYGAAITTVITEIVYFIGYYFIVKTSIMNFNIFKIIIIPMIAAIIMAIVLHLIDMNLFLMVLIGAIVYSISMIILGAIGQEDIDLIKKLLLRN